jgi:hypothetical protein
MDLTIALEINSRDEGLEKTKWIHNWQDNNAYFIVIITEDNDVAFMRIQYNWFVN